MMDETDLARLAGAISRTFSQAGSPDLPPRSSPHHRFQASILRVQSSAIACMLRGVRLEGGSDLADQLDGFGLPQPPDAVPGADLEAWARASLAALCAERDALVEQLRAEVRDKPANRTRGALRQLIALGDLDTVGEKLAGPADRSGFAVRHLEALWLQQTGQVYEAVLAAEALHQAFPDEAAAANLDQSYWQRIPGLPTFSVPRPRQQSVDVLRHQITALQQANQIDAALRLASRNLALLRTSVPICQLLLPSLISRLSGQGEAAGKLDLAGRALSPPLKLVYLRSKGELDAAALAALLAEAASQGVPLNYLGGIIQEAWEIAALSVPRPHMSLAAQSTLLAIRPHSFFASLGALRGELLRRDDLHARDTAGQSDLVSARAHLRRGLDARPESLSGLATPRARACFARMNALAEGVLLYGNHTAELEEISYLAIQLASLAIEKPILSMLRAGSDSVFHLHAQWSARGKGDGSQISLMNIYGMDEGQQTQATLDHLRAGGLLDVANDGLFAPGVRVLVPWIVRPYVLRVFPAQAALATGSKVFFRTIHITEDLRPELDMVEVPPPPKQGSLRVRAIWLTQTLARLSRQFAREKPNLFGDRQMARFGGVAASRPLQPLRRWGEEDAARKSLVGWLAGTGRMARAEAGPDHEFSADGLREDSLRAASFLLHFQANTLAHHSDGRSFLDQHRVAIIGPQGAAFLALSIGALASGSLVCPLQDDLPATEIAERLGIFGPDLIISGASAWTRALAAESRLQHAPVMIMADAGDRAALDEVLTGFEPAQHLPAFQPDQPGLVVFTSGSDGKPKGVVVPAGVLSSRTGLDRCMGLQPADRIAYLTRWDAVGLADLLACLRSGATLVPIPPACQASPVELARWLEDEAISVLSAPTTLWKLLLRTGAWQSGAGVTVKKGLLWGEPITGSVLSRLREGHPELEAFCIYGSTEVTYTAFGRAQDAFDVAIAGSPGGWLVDQTQLAVVEASGDDPDGGPAYSVESPNTMIGYFSDLAGRNEVVPLSQRRVFPLSDRIELGDDGRLHVLGRRDSIIKIAGKRYALAALEHACSRIDGVRTALVFAETIDEQIEVRIVIEAQDGAADRLIAAVREAVHLLTSNAVRPKSVHVLDALPTLPSGKISRQALKDQIYDLRPDAADSVPVTGAADLGPVESALYGWAVGAGLLARSNAPDETPVPELSSLDWMELQLLVEEFGVAPAGILLDPDAPGMSWSELAHHVSSARRPA